MYLVVDVVLSGMIQVLLMRLPLSLSHSISLNTHISVCAVESYNIVNNEWTSRPSLYKEKGSLAGAAVNNKLFAIGGGNGLECFSDVEMFDPYVGRWIPSRSLLQKVVYYSCISILSLMN